MRYLETKHEQNSAKITALIIVILVLLLFVVGPPYMDPPEEYGIAVNFGNSEVGTGNIQPTVPIKSEPREELTKPQTTETKVEETNVEPTKTEAAAEKVLTADNSEAIAIKKQKEAADAKAKADAKVKAEAQRIEREKQEAAEKQRQAEEAKKKKLDALIGGVKKSEGTQPGGEGPGDGPGDKGQLDGSPYAPYKGNPGAGNGGMGYGLNGRGKPKFQIYEGCENQYGLIVVDIVVNQNGDVIEATPGARGSNNATTCLKEQAKKIAKSFKWPADSNAPVRQYGKVSINFTPTN